MSDTENAVPCVCRGPCKVEGHKRLVAIAPEYLTWTGGPPPSDEPAAQRPPSPPEAPHE